MATFVKYTCKSFIKVTPDLDKQHSYKKERMRLKIVGTFQCHVIANNNNNNNNNSNNNNNNKDLRYPVSKFSRQFLNPTYS